MVEPDRLESAPTPGPQAGRPLFTSGGRCRCYAGPLDGLVRGKWGALAARARTFPRPDTYRGGRVHYHHSTPPGGLGAAGTRRSERGGPLSSGPATFAP